MKLYFQSGKKRLAIDTVKKIYSADYFFLGGWKEYIKISDAGRRTILSQCVHEGWVGTNEGW